MRRAIASCGALALALSLSACSSQGDIPSAQAATATAAAAVSQESFDTIQQKIYDTVADSEANLDKDALSARATGPFLALRSQEYSLKSLLADSYDIEPFSSDMLQFAATSNQAFPRDAFALMDAAEGSNLKTIMVYQQDTARDNWKIWASLPILPGQTVPSILIEDSGAETIAADQQASLVASPNDILAAYAAYNSSREQGTIQFGSDALYTSLSDTRDKNLESVGGAGTVDMTFSAGENTPISFATKDGGALVVAQLNFTTSISVTEEGASIKIGSTIGALATGTPGEKVEVSGKLDANYSVMVAFHVPAATSDTTTVQVVGASDPVLLSVANG